MDSNSESPVSRGFVGRRRASAQAERVPPGQYVTLDFPILSAGPTPHTLLEEWSFAFPPIERPLAYVCGPTAMVEDTAEGLVALGYSPQRVRTERFGPSGDRK
jgi:ferredoxin-NADP reductase